MSFLKALELGLQQTMLVALPCDATGGSPAAHGPLAALEWDQERQELVGGKKLYRRTRLRRASDSFCGSAVGRSWFVLPGERHGLIPEVVLRLDASCRQVYRQPLVLRVVRR